MARDAEFHDLLTRFPEVVLRLIGLDPPCAYTGAAPVVKSRERRIDGVLEPERSDQPRVYVEHQRRKDPDVLCNLLKKVVDHCTEVGWPEQLVSAVLFTREEFARDLARPALPFGGKTVPFTPLEVVLPTMDAGAWEQRGGAALAVLPLLGSEEEVKARARPWLERIRQEPGLPDEQRRLASELFLCFLVDRVGRSMDVSELIGGDPVRDTITGQRLLREGRLEGARSMVLRLLTLRLGGPLRPEIERAVQDCTELTVLERVIERVADPAEQQGSLPERILALLSPEE